MNLLNSILEGWGWLGVRPRKIIAENDFGNVLFEDACGKIWRVCPEEPSCTLVSTSLADFSLVWSRKEISIDWEMKAFVEVARASLGPLAEGHCYSLKIPAVLGGEYSPQNVGIISRVELVAVAGSIARQIEGLPDGTIAEFRIVD